MNSGIWNLVWGILASLIATGIGFAASWFISRKRQSDKVANEIEQLRNQMISISDKMSNGFEQVNVRIDRINFEKDVLTYTFVNSNLNTQDLLRELMKC